MTIKNKDKFIFLTGVDKHKQQEVTLQKIQ